MAIRVPKQDSQTSADVAAPVTSNALMTIGGQGLFGLDKPMSEETGNFFPSLKFVYAIEMQKSPEIYKATDIGHVGIFDGAKFQKLDKPYLLTAIMARKMCRKLTTDEKGEKKYQRSYEALGPNNKSDALYKQMLLDEKAERKGASYVVGLIQEDGSALIAQMETCGILADYWGSILFRSRPPVATKILIADHGVNFKTSKTGNPYLNPKQFKQYEEVTLSASEIQLLNDLYSKSEEQVKNWLGR